MNHRSAALLTKRQREGLLRGLKGSSSDRKLRQRINTRIQDSTVDLRLLFSRIEDEELEKVFRSDFSAIKIYLDRLKDARMMMQDYSHRTRSIPANTHNLAELLDEYSDTIEELQSLEDDLNEIPEEESQVTFDQQQIQDNIQELENEGVSLRNEIIDLVHDTENELTELRKQVGEIIEHLQTIIRSSDELHLFLEENYHRFIEGIKRTQTDHEQLETRVESLLERLEVIERTFKPDSEDYPPRRLTWSEFDLVEEADSIDEILDECVRKYSRRPYRYRRRREQQDAEPQLHEAMDILHDQLSGQVFSPNMRDNVVKSIGFYLRVSDTVGADLEHVLEEAVESTITTHRQDEVLDSVSVNINTEAKDMAVQRGREKIGKYRLTNAELRALAGSDTDDLAGIDGIDGYSLHDQLLERLLEEPGVLNSEIEFTEIEPTIEYQGMPVRTDLMGDDAEGNTVLIDIEVDSSEDLTPELERMQLLIDAAKKSDDTVRGIIVIPRDEIDTEVSPPESEFHNIDICPI